MTGFGRYRHSKAASEEWIEEHILRNLSYMAPFVQSVIDELADYPGWHSLYSTAHNEKVKVYIITDSKIVLDSNVAHNPITSCGKGFYGRHTTASMLSVLLLLDTVRPGPSCIPARLNLSNSETTSCSD